ncbi:CAF-1 p150 multi-domain protein [Pyrenophora teres f. teres]|uniref:CAF-1 p150 multi-domain protein n=1 Tax=Pyrenophora teres f. teres TaxID=97479 RepID=A0A6S6W4Q1_9PLEO|nr:CAF-1 p150 multi-domain protein [Pyrenophora teres f. teres]
MGMEHHEVIPSKYQHLSSYYQWRSRLSSLPPIVDAPLKTPSNTTLQIENGAIGHVPPKLKKTSPNFHLITPSNQDTHGFCQTTLSAMLLNYPPPTVPLLYARIETDVQREGDTLNSTLNYLNNKKLVKDEDLVLIVDGQESWFQLPSDVLVIQYKKLLADANLRLKSKYGVDKHGYQKFNQTIIFGAQKLCENNDKACEYVPPSILPNKTYATETSHHISDVPAKFISSKMVMGPAADMRVLYQAAVKKFTEATSQSQTMQSVFATLFAEQQFKRDEFEVVRKSMGTKLKEFLTGGSTVTEQRLQRADFKLSDLVRHEFSMGLDYTHTLFQPISYCKEDELVPRVHDNSAEISRHSHAPNAQQISLPSALNQTRSPFWRPDFAKHNPSPNQKPAYIDDLEYKTELDNMPDHKVPWSEIPLIQNTYTGTIPAILLNDPHHFTFEKIPAANITWNSLWYSKHRRAMLRNYFRARQSPDGYHNSLVGGDRYWDTRGGRGGVWTAAGQIWFPWGEVDGVCGSVAHLKEAFQDGKGVWLQELEKDSESKRLDDQRYYTKAKELAAEKDKKIEAGKILRAKEKERERGKEKEEEERKKEEEKVEETKEEKTEKIDFEKLKEVEKEEESSTEKETEKEEEEKINFDKFKELDTAMVQKGEDRKKRSNGLDMELGCLRYC